MLPRYNIVDALYGRPFPEGPFVVSYRSYDIPNTMVAMIKSLPKNCVACGMNLHGGRDMIEKVERAARKRNMRIIWTNWNGKAPCQL